MTDRREYLRNWRKNNPNAMKEWYKKRRENNPDYNKERYLKQREQRKIYYERNRQTILSKQRAKDKEQMLLLKAIIGNKCQICGSTKELHFHEIHGKPHDRKPKYYFEHAKDFIPLCNKHHQEIHRNMELIKCSMKS